MPGYSLQEIADFLGARLEADPVAASKHVSGLAPLQTAVAGQLSFLSRPDYVRYLTATRATAVIVSNKLEVNGVVPLLRVDNPYLAYAKVSAWFDTAPKPVAGIHPSAIIDSTANIDASASIAALAVVEAGAVVGAGSVVGTGSVVGAGAVLGRDCRLLERVTLYHGVRLGDRVTIHSGAVIGADGFGFAPKREGGWQKIHQLGTVVIGSDVEIGANTTIDRGAIEDTVIGDGVIIDNQVQIAHNVRIGNNTAIAACTGIAGSTTIGANCTIAGAVGIVGHLTIADHVHITAMSLVTGSITEAGSYSGGTGIAPTQTWRRNAVRFGQLDSIARRLAELEKNR